MIFAPETINWKPAAPESMPDADSNVLVGLSTGHSCEGFFDGALWRDVTGWPIEGEEGEVVAWADLPGCRVAANYVDRSAERIAA